MKVGKIVLLAVAIAVGGSAAADSGGNPPVEAAQGSGQALAAAPLPQAGRIQYAVQFGDNGMTLARTVHEWHHDGKRYTLNGEMEAVGLVALFRREKVTQQSEGNFDRNGNLKPARFRLDRGNGKVESATLDWKRMSATVNDKREWPITRGAQDGLSIFYQVGRGPLPNPGLEMDMVSGRKVERYAFDWRGEETISVPAGEYRAWRVRVRATSGDRDLKEVWLSTAANLPVKIRTVDRKGEVLVMVAEKIEFEQ